MDSTSRVVKDIKGLVLCSQERGCKARSRLYERNKSTGDRCLERNSTRSCYWLMHFFKKVKELDRTGSRLAAYCILEVGLPASLARREQKAAKGTSEVGSKMSKN